MIAANHPVYGEALRRTALGAALTQDPLARAPINYRIMQPFGLPPQGEPSPVLTFPVTAEPPASVHEPGPNQITPPIEIVAPITASTSSAGSSSGASSGALPIQVSNIVDPVTGVTYAGYLTQDAQALYQSGSLLVGGNELTPQGSALAAQGDLIQGTPAPTAMQIGQAQSLAAAAAPATDFFSSIENWLSAETLWTGYPNGLIAAGAVIAFAWLFGGRKRGRR